MAQPGTVVIQKEHYVNPFTIGFQHFSGYSEVKGTIKVVDGNGIGITNATVAMSMPGGTPPSTRTFTTNASGDAAWVFPIYQYGTYTATITNVTVASSTYTPAKNIASARTVIVN